MRELMLGNEAVARGAWEARVGFGSGYPGTPSTEILEALARYEDVAVQWAPNEKVGYEVAMGASLAGVRALVTMKHVGLNVAADPLFSSSYMGVGGGLVVVSADDPGMHSSQDEQDNRAFARAAKVLMVEPSDVEEARWMTREAFALSERFDSPVLLRMTTRVCHQTGVVGLQERVEWASKGYLKNIPKYVMLPSHARERRHKVEERLKSARALAEESDLWNPIFRGTSEVGVVTSGVAFGYVREVLPEASILKVGLSHPIPLERIRAFAASVQRLFVVEELEPYLEEAMRAAGIAVHGGRELFPYTGELNLPLVEKALLGEARSRVTVDLGTVQVPSRPPTLCPGCSHRGIFTLFREMKLRVMGDIGCYTLGALKPLAAMDSCMCMGASVGMAEGLEKFGGPKEKGKTVGVIGDSTFFHSGIPALIDMIVNRSTATLVILDNRWTAMTGGQPHPGTGKDIRGNDAPQLNVAEVCRALGVRRVREVDPYDLEATRKVLQEELEAPEVSVVVAVAPCLLGGRIPKGRPVEIHLETCDRCGACVRVGCMALHEKDGFPDLDPDLCTGCGVCVQVCESGSLTLPGGE
ncbi:MAG: indolepyruvate ferredoxin oxidoreductase subunit alpha [Acidobacteriota bacterium]